MRAWAHGHVITLTHIGERSYVDCLCGARSVAMEGSRIGKWITDHRIENFARVKYRLLG